MSVHRYIGAIVVSIACPSGYGPLITKQQVQQPVLQQAYLQCSDDAKADVLWMQQTLKHGLEELHVSKEVAQHFWQRMYFATDPVPTSNDWIPRLLKEWTSPRKVLAVSSQPGDSLAKRCTLIKPLCNAQTRRLCTPYAFNKDDQNCLVLTAVECNTISGQNFLLARVLPFMALIITCYSV